jgi:hypothetical protein
MRPGLAGDIRPGAANIYNIKVVTLMLSLIATEALLRQTALAELNGR